MVQTWVQSPLFLNCVVLKVQAPSVCDLQSLTASQVDGEPFRNNVPWRSLMRDHIADDLRKARILPVFKDLRIFALWIHNAA